MLKTLLEHFMFLCLFFLYVKVDDFFIFYLFFVIVSKKQFVHQYKIIFSITNSKKRKKKVKLETYKIKLVPLLFEKMVYNN